MEKGSIHIGPRKVNYDLLPNKVPSKTWGLRRVSQLPLPRRDQRVKFWGKRGTMGRGASLRDRKQEKRWREGEKSVPCCTIKSHLRRGCPQTLERAIGRKEKKESSKKKGWTNDCH